DTCQVVGHILYLYPVEIKNLTAGKDGRKDFVLLGCRQNKYGVRRWLFQCLQEGIKCSLRQHVHLINDVDFIFSGLWWDAYLLDKATDVIHRIVGGCVQLVNAERIPVLERSAAFTGPTGLNAFGKVFTIYCFRQDTRTRCLPNTTRPTEQKSLRQLVIVDGILERTCNMLLADDRIEGYWAIFACRNNKIIHCTKIRILASKK